MDNIKLNLKGIRIKAMPVEKYTAEMLYKMRFQDTAFVIAKMDTMKKAEIAGEIQPILESLYMKVNAYGNDDVPYEDQPSAAQFMACMTKIKHWETILYWLYEIDIMMGETKVQRLAEKAAQLLAAYERGEISIDEMKRHKLKEMWQEGAMKQCHTDEIVQQAASLARKYYR